MHTYGMRKFLGRGIFFLPSGIPYGNHFLAGFDNTKGGAVNRHRLLY